jgi:RNA polymerase sigma-70 factor (ECF subfamily)
VVLKTTRSGSSSASLKDTLDHLQWESWSRLMAKIQQGDSEAYRQFLNEIGPLLYNYVRRRVFNPEMVPDVYQEVLLTLHKARFTYEPSRPLGPWLFTVARNAILDALGKNRKFAEKEVPTETLPETGAEADDGSLGDELHEALKSLSPLHREAVEILKLRGLSLEDAAKELKISVSALKVRAHRGYEQLRKLLSEKK